MAKKQELTLEQGITILNIADAMIANGGIDGHPITVSRAYRFAQSGLLAAEKITREVALQNG